MYNKRLAVVLLWLCTLGVLSANAQISITDTRTALQLVQKLAGAGVSVSNATLVCSDSANGTFLTTTSNLGLGDGIVLSTGRSVNAAGLASNFVSTRYYRPGDTSLNHLIAPTTTKDACVLEFDFVPLGDTVKFRYVFGSEEYTGFSCTAYNDAFGFFISGPGYTSPQNIALIPGTSIPVAINSTSGVPPNNPADTVKCQSMGTGSPFSQYYVNNVSGTTVTYDGFTDVLTATAIVIPCSTYHLKLAIADADDEAYDSGVFLEAGSFSSNDLTISNTANLQAPVPYCVRGCKNGTVTFKRQKVTSLPLTVKYQIAGDATNGVDYTTIADSVVILANDSVATQTIIPLTTASGTKTVKLLVYSPYACSNNSIILDSSSITIYDSIYARIETPDTSICPGTSLTLRTTIDTNLRVRWTPITGINDTTSKTPTITASANITYYLTATLPSSTCAAVHDNIAISMSQAPNVTTQPTNAKGCLGAEVKIPIKATGDGLTYKWQVKSGSTYSDISNGTVYDNVTKDTLKVKSLTNTLSGGEYRCIVFGKCLPNDTSSPILLSIATPATITGEPINDTLCAGQNAFVALQATGSDLSYQWQISYGFGFSDLINSGPYSGAFKDSLKITPAPANMNGHIFRCIVSGLCPPNDTTLDAKLVVNKLPKVLTDPVNTAVCPSQPSSFSLTAEGGGITYQWQVDTGTGYSVVVDNATYSGSSTNNLQIAASLPGMTGYGYRCVVAGPCLPNDTTTRAVLRVDTIPVITTQPINNITCVGDTARFSVAAYGSGTLSYQWQVNAGSGYTNVANGSQYAGSNTIMLKAFALTSSLSNNLYRCIVQGSCSGDTSNDASLTVKIMPDVTASSGNDTVCEGDATRFTVAAVGSNLVYQWQVKTGTVFTDITDNTVYTGSQTDTLKLATTTAGMNLYTYRCVVSGYCLPRDTSIAAILKVNIRPDITIPPADTFVCDGAASAFKLTAVGTNIAYQWQVNNGSGYTNITANALYAGVAGNRLKLSTSNLGMDGYQYRCIITGTCTPPDTSVIATLHVRVLPQVTADPVDTTICDRNNASFKITAIGAGLNYTWQVDKGTGFQTVPNTLPYTGSNSATLNITGASASMDSFKYRCIITGLCNPSDTSLAATLQVRDLPDITRDVNSSIVCDGQNTMFSIAATGTSIAYQWQVDNGVGYSNLSNSSVYTGANDDTLLLSTTNMPMNGFRYRCIVTGICTPPDTSSAATLTVRQLPDVTMQPKDTTVCEFNNAGFNIAATGTSITYQWQVNNGAGFTNIANNATYSGAATSSLGVASPARSLDGYVYRCIVTGVCTPADTSSTSILHISTPPSLSVAPHATQICEGGDAAFSVTATGTNLTYTWQVDDGTGYVNITNSTLYSGATTNTLYITGVTSPMSGYLYQCIVSGNCPPSVTSGALTLMLTVYTKPSITAQATNKHICAGTNTGFAISGAGTGINYQWQVDNGNGNGYINVVDNTIYSGAATSALNVTDATKDMSGNHYRCMVVGVCLPDAISNPVTLTVDSLALVLQEPKDSTVCEQSPVAFAIVGEGTNRTYQWQEDKGTGFANIPSSSTTYIGTKTEILSAPIVTTQMQGYKYRCVVAAICSSYDTSAIVTLSVDTIPVVITQPVNTTICEHDTATLSIQAIGTNIQYKWQVNNGTGYIDVANSAIYSGATTSALQIAGAPATMSNYNYRCIIAGNCNPADTSADALFIVNTRPNILTQARDTTICEGETPFFQISAIGTALTYQWLVDEGSGWTAILNNIRYAGATTNKLSLSNTDYLMNGWLYICIVSGTCPPVDTSTPATLTVNQLVAVTTQPLPSTICDGDNTLFQIMAIGTGISYQWQMDAGAGYNNITNNTTYSGSTTNTLNISLANTTINGQHYRCIVNGICQPNDTSTQVLLTVNSLPDITAQARDTIVCEGVDAEFHIAASGTAITYQWQQDNGTGFNSLTDNATYTGSLTNILHITSPVATMDNYKYRCIVSGTCTPPDTSAVSRLTIYTSPNIVGQPLDTTICVNNPGEFSIISTGSLLTYQWQIDTGRGYNDVTNSADYTGATTNILTVTSTTVVMNGDKFRCIVNGACTPPDTSIDATLSIYTAPLIVAEPANLIVCSERGVTFTTRANGSILKYQWQVNNGTGFLDLSNGGIYSGVFTRQLVLSTVTVAEDGLKYRCIVNGYCSPADTTREASLEVHQMPVAQIVAQSSTTICSGDSVKLEAQPSTGVAYKWLLDGVRITNAGATHTATKEGLYELIVATQYCTSEPDSLDVIVNPLPDAGIFITDRPIICNDSFVVINASDALQAGYQWYKNGVALQGANDNHYIATEEGLYDLVVTNTYNCSLRSKPQFLETDKLPAPEITTENLMMCTEQQAELYQWYWNGTSLTNEIANCYLAEHNGYYKLFITNLNGCPKRSNQIEIGKDAEVWPNPTAGIINIMADDAAYIHIDDVSGKTVYSSAFRTQVDIRHVADGVYMVRLYNKQKELIKAVRIVKKES
ncbi:MAG: T9SS type A sorting domain-containing protein [Sphingobacteriales bacterium]|nr:MAG: T9SS type A sorting domain-containing protein [Sphingobacteriales bacterium]